MLWTIARDVFLCFAGFLWEDLLSFGKKPDKLYWTTLKETITAIVRKELEHLEKTRIEKMCIYRQNNLIASSVQRHKLLNECVQYLWSNVYSWRQVNQQMTVGYKLRHQFVPNRNTYFSLEFCRQRQFNLDFFYLLDQSSVLYAQFLKIESSKKLKLFERIKFVDTDNTFHNTNFTSLNGALSIIKIALHCTMHSEMCPFVWMCNSRKSTFLHQLNIELWNSHDHPS